MGRRKIEIRPIKDDRNRSVTFLKRKGGLFKKAYELSVLCSVDVAVIIFGHNKKLYEFSSGDINETLGRFQYYAGAHEHKGPQDFQGKGGDDDDEDEEAMGSPVGESHSPPEPAMMAHNLHNQPGLQHIRHSTPSASPPMPNGSFVQHRVSTPQPQNISRPSSRTSHLRRMSSNLSVHQQQTPPQAPMTQPTNYAYQPNPPFYNPQQAAATQQRGTPQPQYSQPAQYTHPAPTHPQIQQVYMQDQRRQSMPPALPPHSQAHGPSPRHPSPGLPEPQHQHHREPLSRRPSPQPTQAGFTSPPLPQPKPLAAHSKNHSIFTPIDDSRSLLAQHWGGPAETEPHIKQEGPRSQSTDVAAIARHRLNGHTPQPPQPPIFSQYSSVPPQRTASATSAPSIPPLSRSSTTQSEAKRPRLKVQIPSEQSDGGEEATADTSAQETPSATGMGAHQNKGVVLPPPSPSTNNALLSAGATGPPNPFARPAPPPNNNPHVNRDHIETPLSALPSRVMDGNMLPSPSDLWQSAWFGRNNTDMLPSPLNFQPTPIVTNGPSFRDDAEADRKRRAEADAVEGAAAKRSRN